MVISLGKHLLIKCRYINKLKAMGSEKIEDEKFAAHTLTHFFVAKNILLTVALDA